MRRWLFSILGVLAFSSLFSQGNLIWPDSSCLDDADGNGIFNYALPTNYRALCTKGLNQ